jgi:FkbM family methyltransferase
MAWWKNEFYSQFGEDAVLFGYFRSRAYGATGQLDDIGEGFFVDIGAHHPYMISNTWFFYQRGWRGINVDPTPGVLADFTAHRPGDITLEVAIAAEDGEADLTFYGRSVKNTLAAAPAGADATTIRVPTLTLATLLDRHLPPGRHIDLMNIDAEGLDLVILRSNDWTRYRPEVLVVEDHSRTIDQVLAGEIHGFLAATGYRLHAWVKPSLVYVNERR